LINQSQNIKDEHTQYMHRCITLGLKGGKYVLSNPMVGALLVHNDRIIGEGYHQKYGGPHAEVNAINSVKEIDRPFISQSTLYVSLEPCCIFGKTPPCTQKIIDSGIKKVVIGCLDPNPSMNGKSLEILASHGIEVIISNAENDAENLIKKFKANLQKRPYTILKWAQSYDGYMGHKHKQIWLSNQLSKTLVHKWRTEIDGILIGTNTALIDNPMLTARLYDGPQPTRIVLDRNLQLPSHFHLLSDGLPTIILNSHKESTSENLTYIALQDFSPELILQKLFQLGIYSLIVEGGKQVLKNFIESNCWDEARIIKTKEKLSHTYDDKYLITAPDCQGKFISSIMLQNDELTIIENQSKPI
jgi:diaminohydroxyphosphoribosylaminopyrimidine deaminase / 5-amino-6-(5-phosphoribosylamino)uracil reductase